MSRSINAFVAVATFCGLAPSGWASDVFLDWDGALINMDAAWADAGYGSGAALTPGEKSAIISMAEAKLLGKFTGYTVTFHTAVPPPVDHEWIKLGSTTTSTTTYGASSGIDWRNRVLDGTADIYLANFGGILSSTMFTRGMNITRFANAIANTTAHELGHNLGLQHYDAYFVPPVGAPSYSFVGEQNGSIMATGVTGLTAMDRGFDRFFNPLEKVKMEYADGVSAVLGTTVAEIGGDHSALSSAQLVHGTALPISGWSAVNVDASTTIFGETDMYKFSAGAGAKISANTISHGHFSSFTDTTMFLLDSSGTPLFMSTDINFFLNDFMTGSAAYYSDDSLIFNYTAPYTGDYYLKITGTAPGDYDLLLTGIAPVPEPMTMVGVGLGMVALARRRRRPNWE